MEANIIDFLARYAHFLAGITWIGLLYYFNFIQGEYFKVAEGSSKVDAFTQLVPRALWWFRWGAMFTFLSGAVMLGIRGSGASMDIAVGAVLGTLMFLNVWLIIWPNQKIVIASNEQVKNGGEALPEAAGAAPKAALASRTNTLFSVPMLLFMASSTHFLSHGPVAGSTGLIVSLVIIGLLEVNGIMGKQGPMTSVKGVIMHGFILAAVLWGVLEFL
ncbi:MAG: urate hydroxylase PuuD [Pseudomonadales bacterium]|nr:urate hydroxylase PuuD [Pseudomonadales bacterium]